MGSSAGSPPDAANGATRRGRITYSKEFLLSVAGSDQAGRGNLLTGVDASVLRAMGWHTGKWDRSAPVQWRLDDASTEEQEPETSAETKSTTFSSGDGCRSGDVCRFHHHLSGGGRHDHQAITKMSSLTLDDPAPAHPPGEGPAAAERPPVPNVAIQNIVKYRLCPDYGTAEGCRWGARCFFAHGDDELGRATVPAVVKYRICRDYDTAEGCKWGERCFFAHGDGELGQTARGSYFKTRLCWSFADGPCAFGGRCHFAHGEHELREFMD